MCTPRIKTLNNVMAIYEKGLFTKHESNFSNSSWRWGRHFPDSGNFLTSRVPTSSNRREQMTAEIKFNLQF